MKILIYGINFAPELTGTGKYTGEMAAWLAAAGHDVHVITAPPYYPEWKVHPGYHASRYSTGTWQGVHVHRVPLWVPAQVSGAKRLLHLASFAVASLPSLLARWHWKPDLVWVVQPPLACAPAAVAFARLRGAKAWLHIQDFEVDAAFDLGILKGEGVRRVVSAGERWLMRRFDRVSSISGRMLQRVRDKGVADARVVAFRNWVDITAIQPLHSPSPYRAELGIAQDAVVALYSGNMGNKQGLEILGDCAQRLRDDPRIVFVLCGSGAGREALVAQCQGLGNVHFIDLQPMHRLGDLLGMADIHLLPQRADAADLVMPSKLTGMLASGRSVLATAHPGTELADVVATCGMVVPPEDPARMAAAITELANDPSRRATLGQQARAYAERELQAEAVLGRFERDLQACVNDH